MAGKRQADIRLDRLIDVGDVDALIDRVRSLVHDEQWGRVVELRDAALASAVRGKQLWPAAAYAEYRLALGGPAERCVRVLDSTLSRFALGPFTEVAAAHHSWHDVRDEIETLSMPAQAAFVQERVVRGEVLGDDVTAQRSANVFELPLQRQSWEPTYPVAEYEPDRATFPAPSIDPAEGRGDVIATTRSDRIDDRRVVVALLDLVRVWTEGSSGRAEAVAVEGSLAEAIGSLGLRSARVRRVEPAEALALMAWAAGNGGAYGRRPGMASGRNRAWWAAAQLAGVDDDPIDPTELGESVDELRWYVWDDGAPNTGWSLRLAVEDPSEGLAWALAAVDAQ